MSDELVIQSGFCKLDAERRLASGWFYVYQKDGQTVVDHSGDFIDGDAVAVLEDAAFDFLLHSREGDEMHQKFEGVAKLVESVVLTPEKCDAWGISTDQYGWLGSFRVEDDAVWVKVKSGEYSAFSIRGTGMREDVDG